MSRCRNFCHTRLLDSFAERIDTLADTVNSASPSGIHLLSTIRTIFAIKGLSRLVIRNFSSDWYNASCHISAGSECADVLGKAVALKDRLVSAHATLCTLPSPFARWAGRRLTGPVLDWNDLVVDLSIAFSPEIQNSLSELEEVL
ncbi:hypothetical protein [Maridesulfovibrio sp.]|uniref:hypothetical protein n=1 Tax=Maridesulfovibrio sp. TaxID=2795000 RepID=UPI002A188770|nr:hypothetical protein [Maridesulfovibrio sp.]